MATYDPNSTENEGRIRLRDPKECADESFYSAREWEGKSAEGVRFIVCRIKGKGKEVVQAVRFKKSVWPDAEKALAWINRHGFERISTGQFK